VLSKVIYGCDSHTASPCKYILGRYSLYLTPHVTSSSAEAGTWSLGAGPWLYIAGDAKCRISQASVGVAHPASADSPFLLENAALAQEKEAMEEAMGSGTNTFSKVSFVPPRR
jgi:hypothetical protein